MIEHLLRSPPAAPQAIEYTEVVECGRQPQPVVGSFGGGQRGVVDAVGLVPSAADPEVIVQGGSQPDNQIGMSGSMIETCDEGRQLGVQPGPCSLQCVQLRVVSGRGGSTREGGGVAAG